MNAIERVLQIARTVASCSIPSSPEDGSSLVEMALSCLILIPVLFGLIQLSFALYCYHYAADAAREASRFAIVRGSTCNGLFNSTYCSPTDKDSTGASSNDITQYVKGLGYPYSGTAAVSVQWCSPSGSWTTCSTTQSNNTPGNQVQVKVTYNYPFVVPFPAKTFNLNIGSVSSMTIVQ